MFVRGRRLQKTVDETGGVTGITFYSNRVDPTRQEGACKQTCLGIEKAVAGARARTDGRSADALAAEASDLVQESGVPAMVSGEIKVVGHAERNDVATPRNRCDSAMAKKWPCRCVREKVPWPTARARKRKKKREANNRKQRDKV